MLLCKIRRAPLHYSYTLHGVCMPLQLSKHSRNHCIKYLHEHNGTRVTRYCSTTSTILVVIMVLLLFFFLIVYTAGVWNDMVPVLDPYHTMLPSVYRLTLTEPAVFVE